MKAYNVEELENREIYLSFLRYMLVQSDAFSLIYFRYSEKEKMKVSTREIKNLLTQFKMYSRDVNEWPGTITLNDNHHIYRLVMYRATLEAKEALAKANSLFEWDYPKLPMDLCFYKNGYAWFAASSHEQWAELYVSDESVVDDLKKMGVKLTFSRNIQEAMLFFEERTVVY